MPNKIKKLLSRLFRMQNYLHRQNFIRFMFAILVIVFGYRIISIHMLQTGQKSLQQRAENQTSKTIINKAIRGDILDRNGELLASSLILQKINIDPTILQTEFISHLAKILNINKKKLQKKITEKKQNHRRYLIIQKKLPFNGDVITKIKKLKRKKLRVCREVKVKVKVDMLDKALNLITNTTNKTKFTTQKKCRKERIAGLAIDNYSKRYYPKTQSLSPLIGKVNNEMTGISGIEGDFDMILAGNNGVTKLSYNSNSTGVYFNPSNDIPLEHGKDIVLTIDANIQFHAYMAIKKAVEKHEAESASAIVLAANGDILAMANYPAGNPNDKLSYNAKDYRNRVLADKFEPGSTMKPFTMLLALEQGKINATEDEIIDVSKRIGHIKPDIKYKQLTIKQILQKSHNLGTVNIADRLSKEDMYNTWHNLGFGQPLGLIPSIESSGSLRHFSSWGLADKYTLSFGHGPMETNLAQLARAYLVFANNGAILNLKLIKGNNENNSKTQVFSKQATSKIAQLLEAVVSNKGSGYRAQIKGYHVGGKTGTAEIVSQGKYSKKGDKRTFFAGFVPVESPKYIMIVRLDRPKKCYTSWDVNRRDRCEGSNSASMAFKEAMENILMNDNSIIAKYNK